MNLRTPPLTLNINGLSNGHILILLRYKKYLLRKSKRLGDWFGQNNLSSSSSLAQAIPQISTLKPFLLTFVGISKIHSTVALTSKEVVP